MSFFLTNLLMFSPLLFLAGLILYILDRAENLRRGAGLLPPEPVQPPLQHEQDPLEGGEVEEGEVEVELEDNLLDPLSDEEDDEGLEEAFGDEGEVGTAADWPLGGGGGVEDEAENPTPQPPAAQPHDRTPRSRTVGAKKARSLARRDQRRAYYEFLQSQQSERARQAAAVAEEEEERLFEEKRRRALAEEEIVARKEKEKAERIETERRRDETRRNDVGVIRGIVTTRGKEKLAWSLEGLAEMVGRDETWVREVLKLEGLVGSKEGEMRMITGEGWYVVVGESELRVLYKELERRGKMEWGEMAKVLEKAIA